MNYEVVWQWRLQVTLNNLLVRNRIQCDTWFCVLTDTDAVGDRRIPQSAIVARSHYRRRSAVESLTRWTCHVDHGPQLIVQFSVHRSTYRAEQQRLASYSCNVNKHRPAVQVNRRHQTSTPVLPPCPIPVAWLLCANITTSIKPEIYNELHYRQNRTERRTQATCTESMVKSGSVIFRYASGQPDSHAVTLPCTTNISFVVN